MALVDFEQVKRHLRVFHDDDDADIAVYQAAAESIVTQHLDRNVLAQNVTPPAEGQPGYDPYAMNITPAITAAILLVIGDLYEYREPRDPLDENAVLPKPVRALLAPWRVWRTVPETQE